MSSDPNAALPNALLRAVDNGRRQRANNLATRKVVRALFGVHRQGATFSRVKGCEAVGPLRSSAGAAQTIQCIAEVTTAMGEDSGVVRLTYRKVDNAEVFRAEFAG